MTISMYQASVPRFANILGNLSAILDKAQAHADAKKLDVTVLTGSRLFPDMFPMGRQVQIACETAEGVVARLAGVAIPAHDDSEKTLTESMIHDCKNEEQIPHILDHFLTLGSER